MTKRARRNFSRGFKVETVRLVAEPGQSVGQVSRDLDLDPEDGAPLAE